MKFLYFEFKVFLPLYENDPLEYKSRKRSDRSRVKEKETDRHTEQTNIHTYIQTNRQIDRKTPSHTQPDRVTEKG